MNLLNKPFKFFITGIGTDVGKTVVASIITTALEADYWKPVQAGELNNTDTIKVKNFVTLANPKHKGIFHEEMYRLELPLSPHISAEKSGIQIENKKITLPQTQNHLAIEGAGGLLVPLTNSFLVADLITQLALPVFVVSKHYLGSINHTLLTLSELTRREIKIAGIIFNGSENKATEAVIQQQYPTVLCHRVSESPEISPEFISEEACRILPYLKNVSDRSTR